MGKIGRNDPGHCGSGLKYERCCLPREEAAVARAREAARSGPAASEIVWEDDGLDEASNRPIDLIDAGRLDEAVLPQERRCRR